MWIFSLDLTIIIDPNVDKSDIIYSFNPPALTIKYKNKTLRISPKDINKVFELSSCMSGYDILIKF